MRVGVPLFRLIEVVDSRRLDRSVIELEFQDVRIRGENLLYGLGKHILVKFG